MRELLRELGAMGKTVILSTHILAELAELCDSIGIIERGQLVVAGRLDVIQKQVQAGRKLTIRSLSDAQEVETYLSAYPGVSQVSPVLENDENGKDQASLAKELEIDFVGDEAAVAQLLEDLVEHKFGITTFNETPTGLEEVFLRLTKGEVA
jgi:ABC-2 type transport system ATP-binding protein